MNLREPMQREWPRHRRFVRSFGCSVPLCMTNTPIEFAHLRSAANAGTALKPHDAFGVSLCGADPARGIEGHHAEYHRIGHRSFQQKIQDGPLCHRRRMGDARLLKACRCRRVRSFARGRPPLTVTPDGPRLFRDAVDGAEQSR